MTVDLPTTIVPRALRPTSGAAARPAGREVASLVGLVSGGVVLLDANGGEVDVAPPDRSVPLPAGDGTAQGATTT